MKLDNLRKKWEELRIRLKKNYKIVILSDSSFEEKFSLTVNLGKFFILNLSLVFAVLIVLAFLLFNNSILQTDASLRREMNALGDRADSLQNLVQSHEAYINNLQNIMNGKLEFGLMKDNANKIPRPQSVDKEAPVRPNADIELRTIIEQEGKAGIKSQIIQLRKIGFRPPLKGHVKQKFDEATQSFGVIVQSKDNKAEIYPTLPGRVFLSQMESSSHSFVIGIKHENNFFSYYKNCSSLLKKVGTFVDVDEPIALLGSEKGDEELKFEIWSGNTPLNPLYCVRF